MLKIEMVDVDGYVGVYHGVDTDTGLDALVAVHNTNLGVALGGCRIMEYDSFEDHLKDVLRLSKGMTYKNSLAGLNLGGGKSVINIKGQEKTPELLHSFGEMLNEINRDKQIYITAGDVGSGPRELGLIAERTVHIQGNEGSDSGEATGYGVYNAILGYCAYSNTPVERLSVAISGLGKVGYRLARFLRERGSEVFVADINMDHARKVADELGCTLMCVEGIHMLEVDVYAPCAVGGAINSETIKDLNCKAVIGGANNQLETPEMGVMLAEEGIKYVPDYLSNSGGVIIIEKRGKEYIDLEYTDSKVLGKLEAIADTALEVLRRSELEERLPEVVADLMAEERFLK